MCELTLLVRGADTGSTPPPICGCVLAVVGTGARALLRFNTHTYQEWQHFVCWGTVLGLLRPQARQGPTAETLTAPMGNAFCCAVRKEVKFGTAVEGDQRKLIQMPAGVFAEQMPGGPYPGKKFQAFTPDLLKELLTKQDALELYTKFEAEVSDSCGGAELGGWSSAKIYEKVRAYQSKFNNKGIHVSYSKATWKEKVWIQNGTSGYHVDAPAYRYWMAYAEISTAGKYTPETAFRPS